MSCIDSIKTLEKFSRCHKDTKCQLNCENCESNYTEEELMSAISEAITVMNEKQIRENLNG